MKITTLGSEARLAMDTQRQNQAKARSPSSVSPVQAGLFQSRPFNDPEQEAAEALASSHQSPDLQTQIDTAARLGHNFSRVQVQSNTPTVIQSQPLVAQPEEQQKQREADGMSEPVKLMAPPVLGKPIQREADEDEPIQMMPQWGWLQRLPQEADEDPIQMRPQLGLLQRQEAQDEDPIQMRPQLGLLQRQEAEADEEPIQMQRIQLKVVVGQPGDKYEQEADSVAGQVMSMSVPAANSAPIQRQGEEEKQEPLVQRSSLADSITPLVQRLPKQDDKLPQESMDEKRLMQEAKNDWKEVKKMYLSDEKVMQRLVDYRKEEVAQIIAQVKKELGDEFKEVAAGSTDLTSDYDVTFDASGNQSIEIEAVKLFNKFFRQKWGKESGTVFDTNVYTTGHMPVGEGKEEKQKDKKETEWQMTQEGEKSSQEIQDVMSLLKIRRFMSNDQWKKYKLKMVNDTRENQKLEITSRLREVDTIYLEFTSQMKKKINALNQKVIRLPKLFAGLRASYIKKTNSDAEMEASNRLYEEYLGKVDETFTELNSLKEQIFKVPKVPIVRTEDQSKKLDELTLKLQKFRSMALVFANEAYHTGGAVEHVVLNQQIKLNISITNQQYLQSINEQTGFALEQIKLSKNLGTALWKSAKYVDRLCDAIKRIDIQNFQPPQEQKKLSELAKILLKIKKTQDEYQHLKTDEEKSQKAEEVGREKGYTSKDAFLTAVLELNQQVNQKIRS